jgi:hypothetical protein
MDDSYQKNVVHSKLTRNIAASFDPVDDEIVGALRDFIPTIDQGISHALEERADDLCIAQSRSKYLSYQHATYRLSNIESGGCGCPSMCVIVRPSVRLATYADA